MFLIFWKPRSEHNPAIKCYKWKKYQLYRAYIWVMFTTYDSGPRIHDKNLWFTTFNSCLVVSNMNFIFHYIWGNPEPIDELIFFKMVIAPPTSIGFDFPIGLPSSVRFHVWQTWGICREDFLLVGPSSANFGNRTCFFGSSWKGNNNTLTYPVTFRLKFKITLLNVDEPSRS